VNGGRTKPATVAQKIHPTNPSPNPISLQLLLTPTTPATKARQSQAEPRKPPRH